MFTPRLKSQNASKGSGQAGAGKSSISAILKDVKRHAKERNFDQAKSVLLAQIELDPANSTLLLVMSKILTLTKDYKGAQSYIERSIKSDPLNAASLLQAGLIKAKQSQHSDAIKSLKGCLQIDPRNIKAHHALQRSCAMISDHRQVIQSCDECLSLYPFDSRSFIQKAKSLIALGQPSSAEELLIGATSLVPDSAPLSSKLGDIYYEQSRYSQAISAYQSAVNQQRTSRPLVYLSLAKSFLQISDNVKCRESIEQYKQSLRAMQRKALSSRIQRRYQYTCDFLYACSLKDESNFLPYTTGLTAILKRMLLDSSDLHGIIKEPIGANSISTLHIDEIEGLISKAIPLFESKSDSSFSDFSDDSMDEEFETPML